ncbi:LOW QUALITY PROTEIN: protein PAT1 homolog 1 [Ciconia maguari]
MFRYQSLEDCPLDEDEDAFQALGEEDEDIDQFNDDTFGAGAVDDDWQEAHERLAELEDKPVAAREQDGPGSEEADLLGEPEDTLAERLTRLVIDSELEDPAIMQAVQTRAPTQVGVGPGGQGGRRPGGGGGGCGSGGTVLTQCLFSSSLEGLNSSIWDSSAVLRRIRGPLLAQEMPVVSVLDYALPQRPPAGSRGRADPSERALPRRSSSPVIGKPPLSGAVPIGTPPKQAAMPNLNQQSVSKACPHSRATMQQRYPAPYGERMSPNQLCNVPNSSLLATPFPHSVSPVLTHLQRAQLLAGAQAGRMSPSQFARVSGLVGSPLPSVNPKLLQGRVGQMMSSGSGFVPSSGLPPLHLPRRSQHPPGPGSHLQSLRPQPQMFRPDMTTHCTPSTPLLHQRQQQNRNQHRSLGSVGDRGGHRSIHQEQMRKDPYANLMLQREKDWVSKIQMMQLQSTDPYLDDYYYQNYFQKLEKLSAAEEVHGDGPKKERTKLITPQVAKLEHTYKPVQFEGSLGKLTVSSVNNPRKMIDAVVTSRSEDDETKEKQVRDKRRQTLVTIEKTYSLLLDVEDYERRYLLSLEGERPALMGERKQKICDMYDNLRGKVPGQERPSDDHFMQIMCIRKGKRLVARILPFLSPEQAADVLMATARNLPFLIKKDAQDEVLPCLLRPFSHVLYHLPLGTVTSLVQQLTNLPQSATAPAPTNLHLTAVLQNKFGLSLLYLVLSRGEELQSSDANTELMQDNQWTELMLMATRELLRIPQAALAKPVYPSNLISFSRYVDQQKLNLLETKLQ